MNIVKNKTNCISLRYNCKPVSVNRRGTVQICTRPDALSSGRRIHAENRHNNIANTARCSGKIWRFVLKSALYALIVIKTAENEVNWLTNPCKTCILYIVFTNKLEWRNSEFGSLPLGFAYGNLFPSYRMAATPSRFFCLLRGEARVRGESEKAARAVLELHGRLFYMENDGLCKFYDALRKLCEKLHTNVQLSGVLVPLSRRAY